jgi:phosphate transport system ATP-binding protein
MNETDKIHIGNLGFFYGKRTILDGVTVGFAENTVTAVTGPSGKGKSSFLTVLNRLWENIPGARVTGSVSIRFGGEMKDIMKGGIPVETLRRKVGMVFQTPNPLAMSVYANTAFPLKLAGITDRKTVRERVTTALSRAHLWDEVKDRLDDDARKLSGGQQQRLCMARALVLDPEVLLLDEPSSSLDARAAEAIEDLILELKNGCTLIVVSHHLDQVNRIADRVLRLEDGRFIE